MKQWIGRFSEALIIAGDFNMPTDSAIYRQYWSRYSNAFSTCGFGFGHTKQSVIRGLHYGLRIDHVLTDPFWRCRRCWVGPDLGSDHLPVIADFYWVGQHDERSSDCLKTEHVEGPSEKR